MTMPKQFDVFFCHNSVDKKQVMVIAEKIRQCKLTVWLDQDMGGGSSVQEAIQCGIINSKSAAIFIGLQGLGQWQEQELVSILDLHITRQMIVIPVLLPEVNEIPKNDKLLFLRSYNWVNFQDIDDSEALLKLQRAINPSQESMTQNICVNNSEVNITPQANDFLEDLVDSTQELDTIKFTNRERETGNIIRHNASPYHLITAHEGYGKTELLNRIKENFTPDRWICVFVSISKNETFKDLAEKLAAQFDIKLTDQQTRDWGSSLGIALSSKWKTLGSQSNRGIAILIDSDTDSPPIDFLHSIFRDFIPEIYKNLKVRHDCINIDFRVCVAARYSSDFYTPYNSPTIIQLSPLKWESIYEAAADYLKSENIELNAIKLLAAHLFYVTGGHPRGVFEGLKLYRNNISDVDEFLKNHGNQLWRETMRNFRDKIKYNLESELYKPVEKLSIFSQLEANQMFKDAVKKFSLIAPPHSNWTGNQVENYYDDHSLDLIDQLTESFIFTREDSFIKNEMTRRLLAIGLLHDSPNEFEMLCQKATQICLNHINKIFPIPHPLSHRIVIQYFFQFLQQHAVIINQDIKNRKKLRQDFLDKAVHKIRKRLVKKNKERENRGTVTTFVCSLTSAIDEDWELQFVINYYLRDDVYRESLYKELIHDNFRNLETIN
jgi:hypothetical protein